MEQALLLSLKLGISVLIFFVFAVPLIYFLYRCHRPLFNGLSIFSFFPFVVPPLALGFYFLLLYSKLPFFNLNFTFPGLVLASFVYNFPLIFFVVKEAINKIEEEQWDYIKMLRLPWQKEFFKIFFPLRLPELLAGMSLIFAHTLGEYGVLVLISGDIPGETKVLSMDIYDHAMTLNWESAQKEVATLIFINLIFLIVFYIPGLRKRTYA